MPFKIIKDGVHIAVRLTPNAKKNRVEGREALANGQQVIKARVHAVPEKGHANDALVALLAKETGIPRSRITLTSGATSRLKGVTITGDPQALFALLNNLFPVAE